jgi:hypothetical protein
MRSARRSICRSMTTSRRSATNSLQPRRSGELDAQENLLIVVVDEHNAHLDGTNAGQIAQLMRRLSGRVQFILGAPTDGKGSLTGKFAGPAAAG